MDWVRGEWFLWGGFVFSCLWHLQAHLFARVVPDEQLTIGYINLGLSGVAFCAFGYLVF